MMVCLARGLIVPKKGWNWTKERQGVDHFEGGKVPLKLKGATELVIRVQ